MSIVGGKKLLLQETCDNPSIFRPGDYASAKNELIQLNDHNQNGSFFAINKTEICFSL